MAAQIHEERLLCEMGRENLSYGLGWLTKLLAFMFLLQLVATITHQSHLCPLPLSVQPIIWNYDHCLHLYPTPHTVLIIYALVSLPEMLHLVKMPLSYKMHMKLI